MNFTIPTPTPTLPTRLTPTMMTQVVIPALNEVVGVDYDDGVKASMLKVQQAVRQRSEHVMDDASGALEDAFWLGLTTCKNAVRDIDDKALNLGLAKMMQNLDIFSIRFLKCLDDKLETKASLARLTAPVPVPTIPEVSTGGTSTPSASSSSRTSPRRSSSKKK